METRSREPARLLAPATVYERTSLSRSTIWRLVRTSEFPAPVRISANRIAWREADIETWMSKWA